MWIIAIIWIFWIICFVDGKTINECRLVLHSLSAAVCQLYLALLPLRGALRQFAEGVRQMKVDISPEERFMYRFDTTFEDRMNNTDSAVHFLEGLCLFWESIIHLLSVVSTLCVSARHVLQGVLFLGMSTARWAQQQVLDNKDGKEEWEKKQERLRQEIRKEGEQVEEFLAEYCQGAITSNRRRNHGKKTGH